MKASITYNAQGEAKVLEWGGYTFFDGKTTDVYDPGIIERARENKFFKVGHVDEHAEQPSKQETAPESPSHGARAQSQAKK